MPVKRQNIGIGDIVKSQVNLSRISFGDIGKVIDLHESYFTPKDSYIIVDFGKKGKARFRYPATEIKKVSKKEINTSLRYKKNPLPSLTGTEKQIQVASRLRDIVINSELEKKLQAKIDKYKKLIQEKPKYKERLDVVKDKLTAYNYMINIPDSNFWLNNKNLIENPYMSMEYFLSDFIDRTKHPLSKYKIPKSNPLPKKAYKSFHGKNPHKIKTQTMYIPEKGLVQLGKVYAIEYECSKLNGGGDGSRAIYRHEFESPAIVACDDRCKKQLYIFGPEIKVSKAGIEG